MQRHRRQRLLQQLIMRRIVLRPELPLMQIVVHIEVAKIGPREQRIAPADKVTAHFESPLRVRIFRIIHCATMPGLIPRRTIFFGRKKRV